MREKLAGSILLSTALASQAVTLGRQSGSATIGRPLDIRVQAQSATDEDLAGQCLRTEVYFGDAQVSPGAVRTTVLRAGAPGDATLRIQTTQPVNEPVVSVSVRAGCNVPFSRRFDLLADFEMEPARSAIGGPAVTTSGVDGTAAVDAMAQSLPRLAPARGSDRLDASGLRSETALPARRPARVAPANPAAGDPASSVVRRPGPETVTGSRLQLDPVDNNLNIDRDPVLRLSMAILSEPTATDEERTAAGLLWKALNASPEDILRDTQKLSVLEAESKGLREQEARNKVVMQEMEAKLEASRYVTWLAYLFGALLLLSLAAMLFLLRKRRAPGKEAGSSWWDSADKSGKAALSPRSTVGTRREPGVAPLDVDLASESSFDDYKPLHEGEAPDSMGAPLTASAREGLGLGAGQGSGARSLATEELFDVQQQADFFVSLGETDKAIDVLKEHLADSQEPSPLAYLDLFRLYHQRGQRAEYEALRVDFNRTFNAGAPPFDQYSDDNRGLEAYDTAFGRIQALWPQPRVLDVIEQSIFKEPSDPEGEVFGLEAYRELLLLHAVAKEMITRDQAEEEVGDFEHTSIKPLKAAKAGAVAAAAASTAVPQPISEIPHVSPQLGLDVDLDALSEMSAFEASLPEVTVPLQASADRGPVALPDAQDSMKGNLIDFEVLDFASSEQDALKARHNKDGGKAS